MDTDRPFDPKYKQQMDKMIGGIEIKDAQRPSEDQSRNGGMRLLK